MNHQQTVASRKRARDEGMKTGAAEKNKCPRTVDLSCRESQDGWWLLDDVNWTEVAWLMESYETFHSDSVSNSEEGIKKFEELAKSVASEILNE